MDTTEIAIDPRNRVTVTTLDIDEGQAAAGVEDAVEIRWRGLTIIMGETSDGLFVYGASALRPGTTGSVLIARATCWTRLFASLDNIRRKWAEQSLTQPWKG